MGERERDGGVELLVVRHNLDGCNLTSSCRVVSVSPGTGLVPETITSDPKMRVSSIFQTTQARGSGGRQQLAGSAVTATQAYVGSLPLTPYQRS